MLLRIWTAGIHPGKAPELEAFARSVSLPMFERQAGCLAVFFTRTDDRCATATLWSSRQAIDDMERSADYRNAVELIMASGTVGGHHVTDSYSIFDGLLDVEPLVQAMLGVRRG